jgi:hypothetical protein|nr:MAG TPA: Ubiquitin-like protein [Crassvirales sp.]
MEETKQPTKVISLVQKSGTYNYKLIIPAEVERKIRFTCQKVWNTEWSGTLFFTHEGSFENNDLVIRCVDIYIMDIGTQAYTEFDMNPDVIAYMTEHSELLDCQLGLIHSHNNMSTFFSGTDTATLKEEGRDRNNFVSLIVNNAGSYTAAITRRIKSKQVMESVSYEFFGDGEKQDTKKYVSDADEIEWFYLKIEKEDENYSFPDMAARLEEIKQAKADKAKKAQTPAYSSGYKPVITNSYGTKAGPANLVKKEDSKPEVAQPTLFVNVDDLPFDDYYSIPYGQVTFDKVTLKSLILQLITGSIIISNDSKIDITKWSKSMPALYEKRFGKGEEGMKNFKIWADTYAEYLTWYVTDEKLEELGFDETEICAICAHDMIEELTKLPENDYIKGYIDALQKYLIL